MTEGAQRSNSNTQFERVLGEEKTHYLNHLSHLKHLHVLGKADGVQSNTPSICLCLSVHLPLHLPVHLSVSHLSVYLYPHVHLYISSIHQFMFVCVIHNGGSYMYLICLCVCMYEAHKRVTVLSVHPVCDWDYTYIVLISYLICPYFCGM